MKKIIITEKQLNLIKESIEIEKIILPDFIKNSIKLNKTSLGNHPAFPPEDEITFQEKILKKRFYELLKKVKKIDGINGDISKKTLIKKLEQLVIKAKKLESDVKEDLEKICFEFVNDIFEIPYGDLDIECVLNDNVSIDQPIKPKPLSDSMFEFEDVDSNHRLNKEIMKRRLVNALIQGASVRFSDDYDKILSKIYKLNPKLPELYYSINSINEYLSFVKETIPNENNVGGKVLVNLISGKEKIYSEAIIFPTLVFETIKGVMELISSHGLPESKKEAEYIIGKADFLLAENWDKRLGVGLWDCLIDLIGSDDVDTVVKTFQELISVPVDNFDNVMSEVFAKTKKGKNIINGIVEDVVRGDKFSEIDGTIGEFDESEEYFTPDELIQDENIIAETSTGSAGDYTYDAPAFADKETSDHSNIIAKSIKDGLNEEKDYYDFFDINYVYELLSEFLSDKNRDVKVKKWRLIPFEQYNNALIEFMRYGQFMRFPGKYIDRWSDLVTMNTLDLEAITELVGHTSGFPYDEFCGFFGFEDGSEEYEKYYSNFEACSEFLEEKGFYDWCKLPDGSDAWSDYGMEPLYKLIMELEEQSTPEQKIVVINKILDVYHQRGDLASAFIEGGSKSLTKISYNESVLKNRRKKLNEEHQYDKINNLKHWYEQERKKVDEIKDYKIWKIKNDRLFKYYLKEMNKLTKHEDPYALKGNINSRYLYHYTSIDSAIDIINFNEIIGNFGISFTTNPNLYKRGFVFNYPSKYSKGRTSDNTAVKFKFDFNLMKNDGLKFRTGSESMGTSSGEEELRIRQDELENPIKYVVEVIILNNKEPEANVNELIELLKSKNIKYNVVK